MSNLFDLVADRSAFFANRIDAYAKAKGLGNQEVVADLQKLSSIHGDNSISEIIDQYVPEELHSSRMPLIRKEGQNA